MVLLGLGKIGRSVEKPESPQVAGMLRKVRHLVRVGGHVAGVLSAGHPGVEQEDGAVHGHREARAAEPRQHDAVAAYRTGQRVHVGLAEEALPGILDMTNRVNLVLSNIASFSSRSIGTPGS